MTRPRAFTLFEVLLVIVLLGVLAAFIWPDFGPAQRAEQLGESSRRVKTLVAMCRAQAMNEARRYRMSFERDGSVRLSRQLDALEAPHEYVDVAEGWARVPFVLEEVWVETVVVLPDGPPPIDVEDELVEFDDINAELRPVQELEAPAVLEFAPDGSSGSARWVLRDARGQGVQMTLDGRLGRVAVLEAEAVPADQVERPPALREDKPERPMGLRERQP